MAPQLLGAIAVAAYSYMSLVPLIQPPIMKLFTSEKERKIVMQQLRPVSKFEKIVFPVMCTIVISLLLPSVTALIGMLNEDTVEVFVDGKPVKMTPIEFKILALLMKNPGRVYSADEIYERVWNEKAINTDTIMVHVRNIRDKIEINPREPKYLKVVWGVGYKMEKQP